MVAAAVPISVLSNDVVLGTSIVVKRFYELCMATEHGYIPLPPEMQRKVVAVDTAIQRVVKSQKILLDALSSVTNDLVESPDFSTAVADVALMVAQTDAAISRTYKAPEGVIKVLQSSLDAVAEHNSHIDNFVESFRIALNESCTALLANLADRVIAG